MAEKKDLLYTLDELTQERDEAQEHFALICQALGMGNSRDVNEALMLIQELHKVADFKADTASECTVVFPTGVMIH